MKDDQDYDDDFIEKYKYTAQHDRLLKRIFGESQTLASVRKMADAWNIVQLGDKWYNIDTTWDTVSDNGFFLKNDSDFTGHVRDGAYSTEEFYQKYPMAEVSLSHP